MKTLLLVRHAKSSWSDGDISDIDRPLKGRGTKDAYAVSDTLKSLQVRPDIIISSPAVRALSTALIFARVFNYPYHRVEINTMVYDFSKEALFPLIRNIDNKYDTAMLVGHDPAFTHLLNDLAKKKLEKIPTGSAAAIVFKVKTWDKIMPGNGRLLFLESPKKEKKKAEE